MDAEPVTPDAFLIFPRRSCPRVLQTFLQLPTKVSFHVTDGAYPWPIRSIRCHSRTWRCLQRPARVPEGTRNSRSSFATVPLRSNPATRRQPFYPGASSPNSWPARAWNRARRTFLQTRAEACFCGRRFPRTETPTRTTATNVTIPSPPFSPPTFDPPKTIQRGVGFPALPGPSHAVSYT